MIKQIIIPVLNILGMVLAFFSIVYAAGIVWRVEKKLDISFKFFLMAILAYALSLLLEMFDVTGSFTMGLYASIAKVVFVALFLAGVLEMRDLIRDIDGENQ